MIRFRSSAMSWSVPLALLAMACGTGASRAADASTTTVNFSRDVVPLLTKLGCNAGSCHGSPDGKGGFRLSLFGYDPDVDAESIVRGGLNRRVDAFTPADSLMLKKPLMRVAHVGGKRLNKTDLGYRVLLDWIAAGAKTDDDKQAACVQLTVYPGPNRVLRAPHWAQQLSVIAKFADKKCGWR